MVILMEKIGIICEYNPFHNGHLYHIKKIKELYPNSLIILVLNGYFLERGEISIQSKYDKTRIAINNGVDLVLELPFVFGTQSADTFADAAVKILNNFHVDKLVFGSESNDINAIKNIANNQLNLEFDNKVLELLDKGINYPTALAKALNTDFLFTPNDLLGISYTKAIKKNKFHIEPITIKRTNSYHDIDNNDTIVSASNIREKLKNGIDITPFLPYSSKNYINNPNAKLFFKILKTKIITEENLEVYLDVNEGIEFRLKEQIVKSSDLEEFINKVKTKRYTYNKINRMLIHILIGLKKNDAKCNIEYIKVLGFNQNGQNYLNEIKDTLKISTTVNKDSLIYKYELKASLLYDLINNTQTYQEELKNKPIIL